MSNEENESTDLSPVKSELSMNGENHETPLDEERDSPDYPSDPDETKDPSHSSKKSRKIYEEREDVENLPELAYVFTFIQTFKAFLKRWEIEEFTLDIFMDCLKTGEFNQTLYQVIFSFLKTLQERELHDINRAIRRIVNRHFPHDYTGKINPFSYYEKTIVDDEGYEVVEQPDYFKMPPGAKILILQNIVDWILVDVELLALELETDSARYAPKKLYATRPLGVDSKKWIIWRFDDSPYLFKESKSHAYWSCITKSIPDLQSYAEKLTDKSETALKSKILQEIIPHLEGIEHKKRLARKRAARLATSMMDLPMYSDRLRDRKKRVIENVTDWGSNRRSSRNSDIGMRKRRRYLDDEMISADIEERGLPDDAGYESEEEQTEANEFFDIEGSNSEKSEAKRASTEQRDSRDWTQENEKEEKEESNEKESDGKDESYEPQKKEDEEEDDYVDEFESEEEVADDGDSDYN